MYVNEVGHSKLLHQNVLPKELGQSVHYYLHISKPMRKGQTTELLVDYQQMYEKSRERKGYGLANINGEIAGDNDEGTRLDRNIAERKEMEKYIFEMTPEELSNSLYFMINKIFDPVMESIGPFSEMAMGKFRHQTVPTPHPRQWLAKRRMEWLGELMKKRLGQLEKRRGYEEHVTRNLQLILRKKHLDSMQPLQPFYHTFFVSNGQTLKMALQQEVVEELLHKSSRYLIRPFDNSLWCSFSQGLLKKVANVVAETVLKNQIDDINVQKYLVNFLFQEAVVAKRELISEFQMIGRCMHNFLFKASLLGKYAADYSAQMVKMGSQQNAKSFGEVDIFNTPVHISVAYESTKGKGGFMEEIDRLRRKHLFYVRHDSNVKRCFGTLAEAEISNGTNIPPLDFDWYFLWQVILVIHGVASECIEWKYEDFYEKNGTKTKKCVYSLNRLCKIVNVDFTEAQRMLQSVEESSRNYANKKVSKKTTLSDEPGIESTARKDKKRRSTSFSQSESIKKPRKSCGFKDNQLFFKIIWSALTKLGWSLDRGNRPTDFYYLPPGVVRRTSKYKTRVDFFDSVVQVLYFLGNDSRWKDKTEVIECLSLLQESIQFYRARRANKTLLKGFTAEWILEKVLEERRKNS